MDLASSINARFVATNPIGAEGTLLLLPRCAEQGSNHLYFAFWYITGPLRDTSKNGGMLMACGALVCLIRAISTR
mgnify:FL=1